MSAKTLMARLDPPRVHGWGPLAGALSGAVEKSMAELNRSLMEVSVSMIKEHLNAESVSVKDAYGDGRHVRRVLILMSLCIDVVSSAFEGQSAVNRQRMVYKAIWEELQSTVHAVDQMTTKTPNEVATDQ
ncbi:BolA-like [Parasponia andersonii]|uniref:BolA-like n=1 Tax=Parasponia andersonii TaxID=3476 RepID=A0A2P5BAE0_PARAD|nr:BolA-like [Parasponia andersonii]